MYHLLRILLKNLRSGENWAEKVEGGVSAYHINIQFSTEQAGQIQIRNILITGFQMSADH